MGAVTALEPREKGAGAKPAGQRSPPKPKGMSDTEILAMVEAEKLASIGFENGTDLEKKRRTSLEYSKGTMSDVPSLANRSKAVSTDIDEAINTILPDLMDIFTSGEDVAAFVPHGEEDEDAAQQETDYVNYAAFQKLKGFLLLHTAIKDALQVDTGIIWTQWIDNEVTEEETYEGITALQLQKLIEDGVEILSAEPAGFGQPDPAPAQPAEEEDGEAPMPGQMPGGAMMGGQPPQPTPPEPVPLYNVKAQRTYDKGCLKSESIDPSNFGVAQDTVELDEAVYCAARTFPRAQALLDRGFDPNKVAQLKAYAAKTGTGNEQTEQARDVAGESTSAGTRSEGASGPEGPDGKSLQRTVEVHIHWIRADIDKAGKSQLWRIQTDSDCKVILDKRKIERRGLAAGTPFLQAHRFYGMSIAEKLIEVQRIKTALLRMLLDSGYFALNQRTEVSMDKANEHTIADLMRNEPLVPVRSKTGDAVRPLQAGQLGFDPLKSLEYTSVMGEQRTGVVRNAQGLNPDTLHDTAKGAMVLMTMAQKRIRMIARVLAETLVKGWFMDIHALSRKHATRAEKIRLRGKWVDIDPSQFGDRADMVIEVGVGAGGAEQEMAIMGRVLDMQEKIILSGKPEYMAMVPPKDVYNALKRFCQRARLKAPEMFFSDPSGYQPPAPQEDPEITKVKLKAQSDMQIAQGKAQMDQQTQVHKAGLDAQAQQAQAQRDHEFRLAELQQKREMDIMRLAQEAQLAREKMAIEQRTAIATTAMQPKPNGSDEGFRPGGRLDQ